MYGWLLESVQHFVIQECGEDVWETILREAGAKNAVFSATQQYPDTLMLRLASALARLVSKDPSSPNTSSFNSPAPKKRSLKGKNSWRTVSVHNDGRAQVFKCPFTATNALTAATKKELDQYNSSEEIRAKALSTDRINKEQEFSSKVETCKALVPYNAHNKMNLELKLENLVEASTLKNVAEVKSPDSSFTSEIEDRSKETEPVIPAGVLCIKRNSCPKPLPLRKTSCTGALEDNRRRGSGLVMSPRLTNINLASDKLNAMKERFGTQDKVMHFFGRCFVKFFSNYGYDTMIRATGRYFCTFLQSVDSIHQRMRFTFPRMRSPSMQLTRAHAHGAELVYSSGRAGFTHYLMGQLYEIAEDIFSLKLKVSVVKETMEGSYHVAVLRLEFDNSNYVQSLVLRKARPCPLAPVPASLLLKLFRFGVMLDRRMRILMAGDKILEAWGGPWQRLRQSPVSDLLRLRKPKISFTWDKVVCMQTMVFELEVMRCPGRFPGDARRGSQGPRALLLKGPIHLLEEIDALIFLCSPIFNDPEELYQAGFYLPDLNGHGLSKEMLIQGWQHLSRLELLFEKAESRSLSLEKSCRLRDQWKKRGDQLLYSMIPKSLAYQLKNGIDPLDACKSFDVTIMFCGFQLADASTRVGVMAMVTDINDVYSKIDRLLDSHRVYKVETVGTVYMVVSGAPERCRSHASAVADAALAVSRALPRLTVGVHSGTCMAGVLSLKLPRYCLVGDTVNTASRMQTTSEPGRIQISSATAAQLPAGRFRLRKRGQIKVKGKGMMETYWLEGDVEEDDQNEVLELLTSLYDDEPTS